MDKEEKDQWKVIARLIWPHGDNYFATPTKNGKWRIGYTNDYPMQHGNGEELILPERMLPLLRPLPAPVAEEKTFTRIDIESAYIAGWASTSKEPLPVQLKEYMEGK